MEAELLKKLTECIEQGLPVALVTVTVADGSSPRDVGSMMVVNAAGQLIAGTIGGGKVEEAAKKDAAECLRNNQSQSFQYELTLKQTSHSLGMACGGKVEVFVKTFGKRDALIIFGGGHIGQKLSGFAKTLGYHITVVDKRPEFCSVERFPEVDQRILLDETTPFEISIDGQTNVVIVTHGHLYDMEALKLVVHSDARYIGMIGSHNKIRHCFAELMKEGITEERLKRVYAPIGLDIGGDTPEEIALAILAEIQAVKYGKSGNFLNQMKS